jgi:Uma2 family endonuclease
VYLIAPEICVEIESPSDSRGEREERKRLYFEKGAAEFWVCDLDGRMEFHDSTGSIPQSRLCPEFPPKIVVD